MMIIKRSSSSKHIKQQAQQGEEVDELFKTF
jgi:hypothetical protein